MQNRMGVYFLDPSVSCSCTDGTNQKEGVSVCVWTRVCKGVWRGGISGTRERVRVRVHACVFA